MKDFERRFEGIAERANDAARAGYPASNGTLLTLIYDLSVVMADFAHVMQPKTETVEVKDEPANPHKDVLSDLGDRAIGWFISRVVDNTQSFNTTKKA